MGLPALLYGLSEVVVEPVVRYSSYRYCVACSCLIAALRHNGYFDAGEKKFSRHMDVSAYRCV